jgi:TPR repeat protein
VAHLRYESGRDDWFDSDSEDEDEDDENLGRWFDRESMASPLFLDSLTSIADGKLAVAHYALALLYAPSEDEFDAPSVGSDYWYNEAKKGRVLMGIEKEWADAHAARLEHGQKYEQHLRKAGELGYADALLELAERFGDQRFFDQPGVEVPNADPARIAEIAKQLRRPKDARYWLAEAAKQGDTEAMRELIERYDSDDLQQCWTWLYLAKLLDSDLSRDEYHAYHENGDLYDDDVGGPLYVDGRDGIKLEP